MNCTRPRVVIAGTNSGVGKTTIVTGLLAALRRRHRTVQPFKIGPDYIDPGFHARAAGRDSYNLDTWLVPEERLAYNFSILSKTAEVSVIEGVMGLYDGGAAGVSSTAAIAKSLQAPVVLVINAQSMGQSAAAIALGYKSYDPDLRVAGVILNRIGSDKHAQITKEAVEALGIPVLGSIRRNADLQTPERHLGLTPVTEIDPAEVIEQMADVVEASVDLEALLAIAEAAPPLQYAEIDATKEKYAVRLGVAKDEAFSFYYPTSLDYLARLGVTVVPFSPLQDTELPEVDGLIFGGGFPEMFLPQLAGNTAMLAAIRERAEAGMPLYAECGGLMYLCREVSGFTGRSFRMVGAIPAVTHMRDKLQRVGYVAAKALRDSILCRAGDELRGHEFHFSTLVPDEPETYPWAYELRGTRQKEPHQEGYAAGNILASYLHLALDGSNAATARFLQQCEAYRKKVQDG
ncbi:MAG: cobyrinate a,c-diamide synthase [Veillonellaceae bacterium]|nr:cobyrinate a,c-diamide synthase [Veillonellaceae bacterium]